MDISNHHSSHYLLHEMKHTNDILNDVLAHLEKSKLEQFIRGYADGNEAFRTAFLEQCGPKPTKGSARHKPADDYVGIIKRAFADTGIKRRGRYWHDYDEIGYDAEVVSQRLGALLEKARYYGRHDNQEEAIYIAQALINTLPDYWDPNYDDEGDVQAVYDESIYLLEGMLIEGLSNELTEKLFCWSRTWWRTIGKPMHAVLI